MKTPQVPHGVLDPKTGKEITTPLGLPRTDLVDQFIEAAHKTVDFVDYIASQVAIAKKLGIYDLGATRAECKEACLIYLVALATNGEKLGIAPLEDWSWDRERIRLVLEEVLNCKEKGG